MTKLVEITSPTVTVTVQELVNTIRDWEDELCNMSYPKVIDAVGKADLSGGVTTGITMTLSSLWQIQFWNGVTRGTLKDGNVVGGVGGVPVKNTGGNDTIMQLGAVATTIGDTTSFALETTSQEIKTKTDTIDWADIEAIVDEIGGKWEIVGNQMIFYKEDNITEVMRFNLFDASGNPAMTDVLKRERVP